MLTHPRIGYHKGSGTNQLHARNFQHSSQPCLGERHAGSPACPSQSAVHGLPFHHRLSDCDSMQLKLQHYSTGTLVSNLQHQQCPVRFVMNHLTQWETMQYVARKTTHCDGTTVLQKHLHTSPRRLMSLSPVKFQFILPNRLRLMQPLPPTTTREGSFQLMSSLAWE